MSETRALSEMQVSIIDEGVFIPMVSHRLAPTPMPMAGAVSTTLEDAEARVRTALANPDFTRGWVVSKLNVISVS